MELLKGMGPSAISVEFHTLGPEGGGDVKQLVDMIHFFKFQLEGRRDYEMVQAYMQVFLKVLCNCSRTAATTKVKYCCCTFRFMVRRWLRMQS